MSEYVATGRFGSFRADGRTHVTGMRVECLEEGVTAVRFSLSDAPGIPMVQLTSFYGRQPSEYVAPFPLIVRAGHALEWRTTYPVDVRVTIVHCAAPEGE